MKLTADVVERLIADPSAEARVDVAVGVAAGFNENLADSERRDAEEIFRMMARDVEVRVRKALAESLKRNPLLPHDVALSLAADVMDVASPILEFSSVLSDEDLVDIIRSQSEGHQKAIAKRSQVSESVSDALVDTGSEGVVASLVKNEGARITETSFGKVVDLYGDSEEVNGRMVRRGKLPVSVAERLVAKISDHLRAQLVSRHELSDDVAADLILEAREMATVGLVENNGDRMDLIQLVRQLYRNGRLTPSIILRAACMGDLNFVEAALAERCGIPAANAYQLIHDSGELGLGAVTKRADIPVAMRPLLQTAITVANESEYDGGAGDRERFVESVIERILTTVEDNLASKDLDYMLEKLKRYSGVGARRA